MCGGALGTSQISISAVSGTSCQCYPVADVDDPSAGLPIPVCPTGASAMPPVLTVCMRESNSLMNACLPMCFRFDSHFGLMFTQTLN